MFILHNLNGKMCSNTNSLTDFFIDSKIITVTKKPRLK